MSSATCNIVQGIGGWNIRVDTASCPSNAPVNCGSGIQIRCCPSGYTCAGDSQGICCPSGTDCASTINNAAVCADPSWNLWQKPGTISRTNGAWCCQSGYSGLYSDGGVVCLSAGSVPSGYTVAIQTAKSTTCSTSSTSSTSSASSTPSSATSLTASTATSVITATSSGTFGALTSQSTSSSSATSSPTGQAFHRQSSASHMGLGVGIAIGVLVLVLIAVLFVFFRRKSRRPGHPPPVNQANPGLSYFSPGAEFQAKGGEVAVGWSDPSKSAQSTTRMTGRSELYGGRPRDGRPHELEALTSPGSGTMIGGTRSELE